jgi:hypothetical protein
VPDAAALVAASATALRELKVPGVVDAAEATRSLGRLNLKDATSCKGKPACVAELGRQLKVDWVVMVSASKLGTERSVALELLQVSSEAIVEKEAVLLAAKAQPGVDLLEAFAGRLRTRFEPPAVTPPADAPPVVTLTPAPRADPLPPPPPPPPERSHTGSFILGGAGLALLAGGAALLALGLAGRASLAPNTTVNGQPASSLTIGQAQATATRSSVELGAAGACGAVGLALGVAAVVTW